MRLGGASRNPSGSRSRDLSRAPHFFLTQQAMPTRLRLVACGAVAAVVAVGVARFRAPGGCPAIAAGTGGAELFEAVGSRAAPDWRRVACLVASGAPEVAAAVRAPLRVDLPDLFPRRAPPPLFIAVVLTRLLLGDEPPGDAEAADAAWAAIAGAAALGAPSDVILARGDRLDTALALALRHLRAAAARAMVAGGAFAGPVAVARLGPMHALLEPHDMHLSRGCRYALGAGDAVARALNDDRGLFPSPPVSRKPLQLHFNMTLYESMRAMFVSRSRELVQR